MKAYQVTGKQLVGLALLTAFFAGTMVVTYEKLGPKLFGRFAGAEGNNEVAPVAEIQDASVASDEKNNNDVYKAMSPGVVNITSTSSVQEWFSPYPQQQQGTGSGSILDKEGRILTNYHVGGRTKRRLRSRFGGRFVEREKLQSETNWC